MHGACQTAGQITRKQRLLISNDLARISENERGDEGRRDEVTMTKYRPDDVAPSVENGSWFLVHNSRLIGQVRTVNDELRTKNSNIRCARCRASSAWS